MYTKAFFLDGPVKGTIRDVPIDADIHKMQNPATQMIVVYKKQGFLDAGNGKQLAVFSEGTASDDQVFAALRDNVGRV